MQTIVRFANPNKMIFFNRGQTALRVLAKEGNAKQVCYNPL